MVLDSSVHIFPPTSQVAHCSGFTEERLDADAVGGGVSPLNRPVLIFLFYCFVQVGTHVYSVFVQVAHFMVGYLSSSIDVCCVGKAVERIGCGFTKLFHTVWREGEGCEELSPIFFQSKSLYTSSHIFSI